MIILQTCQRGPIITIEVTNGKDRKNSDLSKRIYVYIYMHSYTLEIFCPIELICYNTNKINIKETLVPSYSE